MPSLMRSYWRTVWFLLGVCVSSIISALARAACACIAGECRLTVSDNEAHIQSTVWLRASCTLLSGFPSSGSLYPVCGRLYEASRRSGGGRGTRPRGFSLRAGAQAQAHIHIRPRHQINSSNAGLALGAPRASDPLRRRGVVQHTHSGFCASAAPTLPVEKRALRIREQTNDSLSEVRATHMMPASPLL